MGLTLINHKGQTPLQDVGAVSGKNFQFFYTIIANVVNSR